MLMRWYRASDRLLARCERAGWPSWAVTAVAYLVGFEIVGWFVRPK